MPFTFQTGSPTTLDSGAAYSYIPALLGYFNSNYTNPSSTDPFDPASMVLPGQTGALFGDSSVTPATPNPGDVNAPFLNYLFALARVRLRGSAGAAANVSVFFRLFAAQTSNTDYINTAQFLGTSRPNITYPSNPANNPDAPTSPLSGTDANGTINGCTIPFFAAADQSDLQSGGVNNQVIVIPVNSDSVWAYSGCFLDVYDPFYLVGGRPAQHWLAGGAHHCIVAQIAYDGAPIENVDGAIANPENSDKLAQRNLQITPSGNPGFPVTHEIPQTFDTRPSPPATSGYLLSYPDELLIDWRNTPRGSVASIYWPQLRASDVVERAAKLYPAQPLLAPDEHTIRCEVGADMTFIPIPTGALENCAGLITVDLPAGIRVGQEFDIVIRRVSSRQPPPVIEIERATAAPVSRLINWRYIAGTFQMKIPVRKDDAILQQEENLLAILRWRLQWLSPTDRWYPVLQRYTSIVAARVQGLGGNPGEVEPSQYGIANQIPARCPKKPHHVEFAGKVSGLRYDRFGDFEGFILFTDAGEERHFRSAEQYVEELVHEAWVQRILISVFVQRHDLQCPASIVLRRPPRQCR